MEGQASDQGPRPGPAPAVPRRRPGLPPPRGRTSPPWLLPLLAILGVAGVILALVLDEEEGPRELVAVPLYVQVLGTSDIEIPGVTLDFHPVSKPGQVVHRATTDENGVAVLPADKATEDHFVLARGMNGTISASQVRFGDKGLALLELLPAAPVRGEVVEIDGTPIRDATVEVRFRLMESPVLAEVRSDANGEFRIEGLSEGLSSLLLRARADGYAWRTVEWGRKSAEGPRIELGRTVDLVVRLVDSEGKPVAGMPARLRESPGRQTTSAEDGYLTFPGLPAKQPVLLQVDDPERTYRFREDLEPRREAYEVVLEAPATLKGIVVDRDDRALPGVQIRHRHGPRAWVATESKGDGSFTIGDLPSGEVWLEYELTDGTLERFKVQMERGQTRSGYVLRVGR